MDLTSTYEAMTRLRGVLLRFAPPRRKPYHHRPSTYPRGYRLGDLGPASLLDGLNGRKESTVA